MAAKSDIEWTDATWNPITGCSLKSPGCTNCYAMKLAGTRLKHHPSRAGLTRETKNGPVWTGEVRFNEQWLDQPVRWRRPRMIFVCAHGDLFAPGVLREWQGDVFYVMERARQHTYQVLTKRPDDMLAFLAARPDIHPMPNVWLGCSVEDQTRANERIEPMRALAALGWLTWVSYEPALEIVDWSGWEFLRWMVSGGESDQDGVSARPSHPDCHRGARDFCADAAIAYLFKQWGAWHPNDHAIQGDTGHTRVGKKRAGRLLDGVEHNGYPRAA